MLNRQMPNCHARLPQILTLQGQVCCPRWFGKSVRGGEKKADPLHMANTERVGQTPARSWSGCLNPYRSRWASQELPRWASRQAGVRATARGESQVQNVGKKRSQPWRLRQPGRFHTRTVFVARSSTGLAAKNCEKIGPYFHVWLWGAIVSWLSHTLSVSVLSLSATFCSSAWADSGRVPKPCRQPDLTVEVYALGGAIRPNLSLAVFDSPARTSTGGTPEQDFTARGGDLGFVNPWMPTVEGGAIVFPCRFFGLGVHGGGSWSGVPDGTATSPQLAQRTGGQISMMRMSVSVHGQLPLSRYFLLRATVLVGYRNYALSVSGNGQREALVEQVSLEPRLEARLRLPLAVPFGVAAFAGGEVLSQPAFTVGAGLFLATDWPEPLRRKKIPTETLPTPVLATPPTSLPVLSSPSDGGSVAATPVVLQPTNQPAKPVPPVPVEGNSPMPSVLEVTPVAPETTLTPVAPPSPPVALPTPPEPAVPAPPVPPVAPVMIDGLAFMQLDGFGIVATQSDVLNVRRRPSKNGPLAGTVQKGSRVQITGVGPGWYRISFQGTAAYVSADFIQREP